MPTALAGTWTQLFTLLLCGSFMSLWSLTPVGFNIFNHWKIGNGLNSVSGRACAWPSNSVQGISSKRCKQDDTKGCIPLLVIV